MKIPAPLLTLTLLTASQFAATHLPAQSQPTLTGEKIMHHASGSFEVKVAPADPSLIGKEGGIGRMTIDKILSGDLTGTTKGEMLTTSTETTGAMAYVAVETVTAALADPSAGPSAARTGTFVLMHNATMTRSDPNSQSLHISVVPGSGTAALTGLSGTFTIHIDPSGKHTYTFDYTLL